MWPRPLSIRRRETLLTPAPPVTVQFASHATDLNVPNASMATRPIMVRLKTETAEAHARVDALMDLPAMTRERYRASLAALRDAHAAVDRALAPHAATLAAFGYHVADRGKLGWLEADLAALGAASSSPGSPPTLHLTDGADAFGAIYVMEGSTLGGQVIARHVIPALGVTPADGCRYFTGYGASTGERWRDTMASITRFAETAGDAAGDRMVAAANRTFALVEASLRAT